MNYGLLETGSNTMEVKELSGDVYPFICEMVGGIIQFIKLSWVCEFKLPDELKNVEIILNEEGKLKDKLLPINLYSNYDRLHGNLVFATRKYSEKHEALEIASLSDKQLELLLQVIPKLVEASTEIKKNSV